MRNPAPISASDPRRIARTLTPDDLDRVVAIDEKYSGYPRQYFFEKRFDAAKARPGDYLQIGITIDGRLHGFAIARILHGEYGHKDIIAVVDALGVDPEGRERGIGQSLMRELVDLSRRQGVRVLQSQADWTNQDLLKFFAASHFELAPRIALERPVTDLQPQYEEEV